MMGDGHTTIRVPYTVRTFDEMVSAISGLLSLAVCPQRQGSGDASEMSATRLSVSLALWLCGFGTFHFLPSQL